MKFDKKFTDGSEDTEEIVEEADMDISLEDISTDSQDKINKLKSKLNNLLKEKEEYLSGWQRCRADFVNAKRSHEAEKEGWTQSANELIIKDLLPILDSFNLALSSGADKDKVPEGWLAGFSGIYSKLIDMLTRRGLKQIGRVGDRFDVNEQEPVSIASVDREELDDTVTQVLQMGYKVDNRVIRPAKVVIGQFKK